MKPILPVFGVDDDRDDTELMSQAFQQEGIYDYYFFPESEEFFAVFDKNVPVIVLDYNLPGMNGQDIIFKAKTINPLVRPILISGALTEEMKLRLSMSGGVDFVVKKGPDWAKELAGKVKHQLNLVREEMDKIQQEHQNGFMEIKQLLRGNK